MSGERGETGRTGNTGGIGETGETGARGPAGHARDRPQWLRFAAYGLVVVAAVAGLLWVGTVAHKGGRTAAKAETTSSRVETILLDIQRERRRNTINACKATFVQKRGENAQNAAFRGFLTSLLTTRLRRQPEIAAYLRKHRDEFPPPLKIASPPPPSGRDPSPAYMIGLLESLRRTFPVLPEALLNAKQVEAECRRRAATTVKVQVIPKAKAVAGS